MKRTLSIVLATSAGLAATGVAATAATAGAAAPPVIHSIGAAPNPLVVKSKARHGLAITVQTGNAQSATAYIKKKGSSDSWISTELRARGGGLFTGTAGYFRYFWEPGTYVLSVDVLSPDHERANAERTFELRRGTYFQGADARPSGRKTQVHGRLMYLNKYGAWTAYKKRSVSVYAKVGAAWKRQATVTTDRNGRFSRKFTPVRSGTWKIVYTGDRGYYKSEKTLRVR